VPVRLRTVFILRNKLFYFFSFIILFTNVRINQYSWLSRKDFLANLIVYLSILISILVLPLLKTKYIILLSRSITLISVLFFYSSTFIILYFFFELSIVPILLLIIGYGYQVERLQAARYLMIYTILCSLPFIFLRIKFFAINNTLYFFPTYCSRFSFLFKTLMLVVFFVKLPIFLLHLWLPKAHVEAPTVGSILLAAILLKLGGFGVIRMLNLFKNYESIKYFIYLLFSVVFANFLCAFQRDAKRLVAYSSISHMNFYLFLVLLFLIKGKISSIYLLFIHGIVSGIIFFIVGWACQNSRTRSLYFLSLLFKIGIVFQGVIMLTLIANFRVPPFLSSVVEIYFISCLFTFSKVIALFIVILLIRYAYATLYLLLNIIFGNKLNKSEFYLRERYLLSLALFIYFVSFIVLLNF